MTRYEVKDAKVIRSNPFCPRCGKGVMMADRGDWWSCGKCGDRYNKPAYKCKIGVAEYAKENKT